MCVLRCSRAGAVDQSNLGFVHPQHRPVLICPTFFATCHAHIFPPKQHLGVLTTPMHYLGYDFLFLWLEQPSPPTCRTLCLRKVGVGCGIACWFGPRLLPTPSPRNKTLLKLSIYYVCPKPDYNDTTTKKTTVSLLINMRQAQELIGHE